MEREQSTNYIRPNCKIIIMECNSSFLVLSGGEAQNEKFNNQTSYTNGNNGIWQ